MSDFTHIHTHTIQAAGETKGGSVSVTAKGELRERPVVATGQTVFLVVLPINVSKLKSLFWGSDKAVTITPMNDASPGTPIAIPAGGAVGWFLGCGSDCPLAADTTHVTVANASGSNATLDLIHLVDPTVD